MRFHVLFAHCLATHPQSVGLDATGHTVAMMTIPAGMAPRTHCSRLPRQRSDRRPPLGRTNVLGAYMSRRRRRHPSGSNGTA